MLPFFLNDIPRDAVVPLIALFFLTASLCGGLVRTIFLLFIGLRLARLGMLAALFAGGASLARGFLP